MSIAAIGGAGLSPLANLQHSYRQVRGEFQQLGQDLAAGNLSRAQTDFVSLSQAAAVQFSTNSPINKALGAIGQALQSGNLSAAQQAYSNASASMAGPVGNSHRPGRGPFAQPFSQLAQALQSGNLLAAQQAFAAFQQVWQQYGSEGYPGSAMSVSV